MTFNLLKMEGILTPQLTLLKVLIKVLLPKWSSNLSRSSKKANMSVLVMAMKMMKICGMPSILTFTRELIMNLKDKRSRKEAKAKYIYPLEMNTKFAFLVKDRQLKVKTYLK